MDYAEMWLRVKIVWAALWGIALFLAIAFGRDLGNHASGGISVLAVAAAWLPFRPWPISLRLLLAWLAVAFCGAATKGPTFNVEGMLVMTAIGLVTYGSWLAVLWICSGLKAGK